MQVKATYKVGEVVCYQIPDDPGYAKIAPIQDINYDYHKGKVRYKLSDEWVDSEYIWYSHWVSGCTTNSTKSTINQPMSQPNGEITITRSIELRPGDSWSYIITDSWQDLGVDGITIYYVEPGRPKEQLMGTDTKTARAIANAILELTENNG